MSVEPEAAALRVLIADDHAGYRDGLARLLAGDAGMAVVGLAADGDEAVEETDRLRPDVVLLDHRMPRMDGVEACRRIRTTWPEVAVVLITGTPDPALEDAAAEAGAARMLAKDASPAEIGRVLQAAAAGR